MVGCNVLFITLTVTDDVLLGQSVLLTKVGTRFYGLTVHLLKVGIIRKTVLADFKTDMSIVCTASGVPSTMIPRECLIGCNRTVSQLADKGMNADLSSAGMISAPVIAILVFAKQTIVGTYIAFQIRVVGTRGMNHDAFDRDFPARLVAGIFR